MTTAVILHFPRSAVLVRRWQIEMQTAGAIADGGKPPGGPLLVAAVLAAVTLAIITSHFDDGRLARRRPGRNDAAPTLMIHKLRRLP